MAKRVLLTGCNGFLGAHILSQLLAKGISVRGIVRSQAKADQVRKDNPSAGETLDFGIVPDLTAPGAFDEVIKVDPPFDAVIHTASPFLYKAVEDNEKDFLAPAINGTEEILKAIKAFAPSVKRVVFTSSVAAVLDFKAGDNGKRYTADDWNPTTWEQAVHGEKGDGYRGSKKYAEKAGKNSILCFELDAILTAIAWDFVEQEEPNFDLVTLCPPMIYGPLAHTIASTADLNQSNERIYLSFMKSSKDADLPPNALYLYVDVRDIAAAHIQAMVVNEASNKRFIVSQGQISSQQISDILRSNIPELETKTPMGKPGSKALSPNAYSADSSSSETILGIKYRDATETFVDLGRQLLAIEGQ